MLLQGNLQNVFDALYTLGVIEPVLNMDWSKELDQFSTDPDRIKNAIVIANYNNGDVKKMAKGLSGLDAKTLNFLAMEVAREYAGFYSRGIVH